MRRRDTDTPSIIAFTSSFILSLGQVHLFPDDLDTNTSFARAAVLQFRDVFGATGYCGEVGRWTTQTSTSSVVCHFYQVTKIRGQQPTRCRSTVLLPSIMGPSCFIGIEVFESSIEFRKSERVKEPFRHRLCIQSTEPVLRYLRMVLNFALSPAVLTYNIQTRRLVNGEPIT